MELFTPLLPIAGFLALLLLLKRWKQSSHQNPENKLKYAPESAGGWPVIGHLLQLTSHETLARSLGALADKYGPVFRIRIGMSPCLVVSNWEAVKECFTSKDKVFASRPNSSAGIYLGYNYAGFGFAAYGPYWRELRKIVLVEVLSSRRLESLRHIRISELENSIRELFWLGNTGIDRRPAAKVVMSEWFEQLTLNIIVRTITGKRYNGEDEIGGGKYFRKVVKEFMHVSGQFVLSDVIPVSFLKWLEYFLGHIKTMKRIAKELDTITQIWIDDHVERRRAGGKTDDDDEEQQQDFIDVMLSAIKDDFVDEFGHSRETVIKATVQNIILAGSDTTSTHLTWVLSLLLNNPHDMKQAQEEIDHIVGKERWAEETDIKNLVYLQAIVKEALRLYPPGPISVPHLAREDTEVSGYHVPKGTRLFVNLWKLHRDPRIWSDPDTFLPERFMGSHAEVDFSGQNHFEFIPFGSGRRACPGLTFAMQVTHLTLARLLQGFSFATVSELPVDMAEGQGITLPKLNPLEVLIMPRLSHSPLSPKLE
ncbi:OLC1v1006716C1 [Oldenlandia corymbosa var. corymbosa]|uniref:OLC1v1006716C1 n=1 Tax=Oldenlandia corymbosa var. corymbosa TaxID=529605 RepID=A0AAV1DI58_OLDCO|nr:OLC1v1006716C1 [Oldenlandia corymbosa var. corymbosa]